MDSIQSLEGVGWSDDNLQKELDCQTTTTRGSLILGGQPSDGVGWLDDNLKRELDG